MLWHAMPPELNTARLMMGAGPAPMLQAAAGWAALGAALEAQADELAVALTALGAAWSGVSGERAIAAATPMVAWLRTTALHAQRRAQQATAQAAAYTKALATTPSLPEIAANQITRSVLVATNFLGINTVPIAANEADYFVRMWNQAAGAMDIYQAETAANTVFEPLPPVKPVLIPGVGEAVKAATAGALATMATKAAVSDDLTALASRAAQTLATETPDARTGLDPRALQVLSQLGQFGAPLQQLTQMIQQVSGMAGAGRDPLGGVCDDGRQLGLFGADALSTHPLAGGSGPATGAGLLRGDVLPGAGGSAPRSPLLAQLLEGQAATSAAAGAGAGVAGAAAGAAGSGMGAAPLGGMPGHGTQSGSSRTGLTAVGLYPQQDEHDPDRDGGEPDDDW